MAAIWASIGLTGAGAASGYELPTTDRMLADGLTAVSDLASSASVGFGAATAEVFGWPFRPNAASMVVVSDTNQVGQLHEIIGYELDGVRNGVGEVPRLYLSSFPDGWTEVATVEERKALFFKTFLPLMLRVNEAITADRAILINLRDRLASGVIPSAGEMDWLIDLALLYRVLPPEAGESGSAVALTLDDIETMLTRVDIIPPSLAMAQAVEESGWGRSRFAQEGNAMFGQYTWSGEGILPMGASSADGARIRTFDSLLQSVAAYAINLNTHGAYGEFRAERSRMRENGEPLDGRALVSTLTRYSQRPGAYMRNLRATIDANDLREFDTSVLAPGRPIHVEPARF
ncbi:MAG: glucosaminidase domain-containing protein [Alphaproteobacteria bacterium]